MSDPTTLARLIAHVGCGSVDEHGRCATCDEIRAHLRLNEQKNHAPHEATTRTWVEIGALLAWLNDEQKHATRWVRPESGVLRFAITGPELMRIRRALEQVGVVDDEAQHYFDEWCREENRAEKAEADLEAARASSSQPFLEVELVPETPRCIWCGEVLLDNFISSCGKGIHHNCIRNLNDTLGKENV